MYFTIHPEAGGASGFGTLFDAPDPCDCYQRFETVVPQQSLAMANSQLSRNLARELGELLGRQAGKSTTARIRIAFEELLSRPPSSDELKYCQQFLDRQMGIYKKADPKALQQSVAATVRAPAADPAQRAFESLIRALFNHTDFITIR